MYETIKYEVKDGIGYVTISRPKAMNAINSQVLDELYDLWAKVERDDDVKVIIMTGEGKAFVAGADIAEMNSLGTIGGRAMIAKGHDVMNYMEQLEKPIIAAVNGFALGGGCELSMACDIRIASEKAKFGQPEVGLGIIPGFGGTLRLPRLIGKGPAKYLLMTGEMIDAQEAYRLMLVEKVVPHEELMEACEAVARTIMSNAPIAVGVAKKTVNTTYGIDLHTASAFEVEAFTSTFGSMDKTEGMTAFLEKRKADFQGK